MLTNPDAGRKIPEDIDDLIFADELPIVSEK